MKQLDLFKSETENEFEINPFKESVYINQVEHFIDVAVIHLKDEIEFTLGLEKIN